MINWMPMKRVILALAWLFALALGMALLPGRLLAEEALAPKGAGRRTLPRQFDVIKVNGELLSLFEGVPIARLSLLAFREGVLAPIPFQIDERDRKGHYVMTAGKIAGGDEDNGKLDANDELVFLVSDAGDQLPEEERLAGGRRIEIEITDPRYPDQPAWAYLARYQAVPPRSALDYIHYDPETERMISPCCIIGYPKGLGFMFYNDLIYLESAGGDGRDFLDRIKFRFTIDFFGGMVTLKRNEECFGAEVQGWIDGPVRVLLSSVNHVKLFEGLPSVSFDSVSEYYPHLMSLPLIIRFPFNIRRVAKVLGVRTLRADLIGDLSGMIGGKAYTNLGLSGFTYTGHTPPAVLDRIEKKGIVWGLATKEGVGTWFPRVVFPDAIYQFNSLYFTDDLQLQNPPDDVPGEVGNGLRLEILNYPPEILDWLGTESFVLRLDTYFARPGLTPAEAREWLDLLDYPLSLDIHGGQAAPGRAKPTPAGAGPPWEGGRDGVLTDTRNREIRLKRVAYFVGAPEAAPRALFLGERVTDQTFHLVPLAEIRSLENHYVEFEPVTKTQMALFSELILADGSRLDLLSCKICGWAGADPEGRVIYLSNVQIQRIVFEPCNW